MLTPGVYALWKILREVVVEVVDATVTRFENEELRTILGRTDLEALLRRFQVPAANIGLYFEDGRFVAQLEPGVYAAWMNGVLS